MGFNGRAADVGSVEARTVVLEPEVSAWPHKGYETIKIATRAIVRNITLVILSFSRVVGKFTANTCQSQTTLCQSNGVWFLDLPIQSYSNSWPLTESEAVKSTYLSQRLPNSSRRDKIRRIHTAARPTGGGRGLAEAALLTGS